MGLLVAPAGYAHKFAAPEGPGSLGPVSLDQIRSRHRFGRQLERQKEVRSLTVPMPYGVAVPARSKPIRSRGALQ